MQKFTARFNTEICNGDLRINMETKKAIITDYRAKAWDLAIKSAKRNSDGVKKVRCLEIINPLGYKPLKSFGFTIQDVLDSKGMNQ